MRPSRKARLGVLVSLVAVQVACSGDAPLDPAAARKLNIAALSPTHVVGTVNTETSSSPSVRVTDSLGTPASGVEVIFAMTGDGATTLHSAIRTGTDGIATVASWRLGTRAGTPLLRAAVSTPGTRSVMFTATALPGPAASIVAKDTVPFAAPGGLSALAVRVADAFDNPVEGTAVAFAVERGGGTVASPHVRTDSSGAARTSWRIGAAGEHSATAVVDGLESLRFRTIALDGLVHYELVPDPDAPLTVAWIALGPDSLFLTSFNGVRGSGTYALSGTKISFTYAGDFLQRLAAATYLWAYPESSSDEVGSVVADAIVIRRCFTEDCYDRTFMYQRK